VELGDYPTRRRGRRGDAATSLPLLFSVFLPSCKLLHPVAAAPEPIVRVDTMVLTKEVPPPIPQGVAADICLSTGQTARVFISPTGDTLIGPSHVRLRDAPGVALAGTYAGGLGWFASTDSVTFEKRTYKKFGAPAIKICDDLKRVGDYNGIAVLADVTAPTPLAQIYIPIRPGIFQPYTTQLPKRSKR
jgi:hypothetical protein